MSDRGSVVRGAAVVVVAALVLLTACGDGDGEGEGDGASAAAGARRTIPFSGVYIDPHDPQHLIVGVAECTTDAEATVDASGDVLRITINGTILEPPCTQEQVDVTLEEPFDGRQALDVATGRQIDVVPAGWLLDTGAPQRLPADCSTEAVKEAVAAEIDGDLRRDVLSCDEQWLVVRTWKNACPPTEEPIEDGCLANDHTAYFANEDDVWRVFAFDDCDTVRRERPEFPADRCE